ncbi:hypothetical protein CCR75_007782 [Bremia lactucae]|uniref:SPIN90/Ldb17 leucine-rich domain-containing protein n=1 Tax=Bremia lactucae TaxID=4779 RepID=A0A976IIT3_BRELC|nr:hypothetical protein CCR75_007782 [Bremia lactucae]
MEYSEDVKLLTHVEQQLCAPFAGSNTRISNTDICELWKLVSDVVFSPLWLRIRAAGLLHACCNMEKPYLDGVIRTDAKGVQKLRAIVSSTCQAVEELDATNTKQAEQLFTWFGFLEIVMMATHSDVFAHVNRNSMYASMLTKMLRLLSACSTKVFAATVMCLGLFHDHEKKCERSVLVQEVLRDMKDGRELVSGALLHVINSCGCPCPTERTVHLWNALQLFEDILADKIASMLVFVNDFKILIDLIIRECADLPQKDITRLHYLEVLEQALQSQLFPMTQMYRKRELCELLESLLDAGAQDDSFMPKAVIDKIKQILVTYIDLLD